MGAPHNTKRYGETWDAEELALMAEEIETVRGLVTVSGGWAWHFLSPPHEELKHAHDHKDADLFVTPERVWELMARLTERGFAKAWTRFDGQSDDFHRYVKTVERGRPIKIIFDLFTQSVPSVITLNGICVVEPTYLLSLYGIKHSSVECFSVQIATALLARGISPASHPEMSDYRAFLKDQ